MEWISVKDRFPDSEEEEGYYVVMVCKKPHIVYFSFRNWQRPWHIPDEWQDPSHYIKLDPIKDVFFTSRSKCTMD